jgi:uncharacterized protein YbjT (DUF2867 family)
MKPILITGATGNVGGQIVKLLHEQGLPVRAAVISEADAANLPAPVEWCTFDFTDPATYGPTFENVETMFLMRPPHISDIDRDMKPAMQYAAEHGVKHMVFLSLLGAEKNKFVPHAKVEKLLLTGEVDKDYTLLRCGFFMQNLTTTHLADIRDQNDIFIPAGRGKTAFIDARDIAAVAVLTLTQPGHENKAYPLTGSETLGYHESAALMTEILGRPIRYSSPSPIRFAWRKWREGLPLPFVGVVSAIYLTTRFGLAQTITPHTADLLGRPPITLRQFIADFAELWQPQI